MLHSKADLLERVAKGVEKLSKRTITTDDARILRILADQVDAAFKMPDDPHIWAQVPMDGAFWIDYLKYLQDGELSTSIINSFSKTVISKTLSEKISRELDDLVARKIPYVVYPFSATTDIHLDIDTSDPLGFEDNEYVAWHIMGYSQYGTGDRADRILLLRKP
jgi:hypothetical protein